MDRLTVRIDGYAHGKKGRDLDHLSKRYYRGEFECTALVERLAEYEDAEEQGLLLHPKCKPGDIVWEIHKERHIISEFEIGSIHYDINHNFHYIWKECRNGIYKRLDGFWEEEIGKTVFLTREEAEKALERE